MRMARDLLGHASMHTTNTYRSIAASRLYSTVLSAYRIKATAKAKLKALIR
jgi:site-specific recombinase XerD